MIETIESQPCVADHCDWRHIPRDAWVALSADERAALTARGIRRRGARGLCQACLRRGGAPPIQRDLAGRANPVPREMVVLDWNWLHETGELRESDSLAWRISLAAPRIGMSRAALEKALERAGILRPQSEGLRVGMAQTCRRCRGIALELGEAEKEVRYTLARATAAPDVARWRWFHNRARRRLDWVRRQMEAHELECHATEEAS